MIKLVFMSLLMSLVFLTGCNSNKIVEIEITPKGNAMEFATKSFEVKAGQEVKLIMNNTATMAAMKHNVVILNDKSKIQEVGLAALSAENYLPDHPAIIIATPMADAGKITSVTFKAPNKTGEYTYICTFPGHYNLMQGKMIVN